MKNISRIALVLLFSALGTIGNAQTPASNDEDWANSPEAYFLTKAERADWKKLDSRESRESFKQAYWLKRDPTPGTAKNEFREGVAARIETAEKRWTIEGTPGARTSRGRVFIVFGSPARVAQASAPRPQPPPPPVPGGPPGPPQGFIEGNETTEIWAWDRERTPQLLEMLGTPQVEVKFIVEPTRRTDRLQNPGLFHDYQEVIASRSIVNPQMIAAADAPGLEPPLSGLPLLPRETIDEPTRAILTAAAAPAVTPEGISFSSLVTIPTGSPETFLWFFVPSPMAERLAEPRFSGSIAGADGVEVASFSSPASPSPHFSTSARGAAFLRRVPLPPGEYKGSFALTSGGKPLASAAIPLSVPDPAKGNAVSSLILTSGAAPADPGEASPFRAGEAVIPPRADAHFSTKESLWYFIEVADPVDPAEAKVEARLRRVGGSASGASTGFIPANLQQAGEKRFVLGLEMPLAELKPGDYSLYVTLSLGGTSSVRVVRRADFRLADGGAASN
ncbi:MAG TPA: GWxTD domain-containing protein [Thermoanaerobaculia bacterium]